MVTHEMMAIALVAALGAAFLRLRLLQRLCAWIALWAALGVGIYVTNEILKAIDRLLLAGAR
ncbi:hypothetical protein ACFU6S_32615 [Streptomyces sp. NPDC057456]|uniref:hypothetical protein n=1 Tax=Streptomyces sp. NPDC057456 TaxID=3346139 RepID=UPI00368A23A1